MVDNYRWKRRVCSYDKLRELFREYIVCFASANTFDLNRVFTCLIVDSLQIRCLLSVFRGSHYQLHARQQPYSISTLLPYTDVTSPAAAAAALSLPAAVVRHLQLCRLMASARNFLLGRRQTFCRQYSAINDVICSHVRHIRHISK